MSNEDFYKRLFGYDYESSMNQFMGEDLPLSYQNNLPETSRNLAFEMGGGLLGRKVGL
jgi:hypothetical protein